MENLLFVGKCSSKKFEIWASEKPPFWGILAAFKSKFCTPAPLLEVCSVFGKIATSCPPIFFTDDAAGLCVCIIAVVIAANRT